MRRLITALLTTFILVAGGLVFYFYFPKIWGSVVYPLKYEDLIDRYAKEHRLSPFLVAAVIFVESRFNEYAVSPMGARGLMQIMPQTASRIAKTLGDKNFSTDKLFEPERNIRYGTYYLKELLDRHQNNLDKALMAYNGGEMAVIGFEKRATLPRETNEFVKRVKNAQYMYERIYSQKWQEKNEKESNQGIIQQLIENRVKRGEKLKQNSELNKRKVLFGPILLIGGWL